MTDVEHTTQAPTAETVSNLPTAFPPTDIIETNENFIMLLDIPGADPDSLNVLLDRRVLSISARTVSSEPEGYALILSEYREANYDRRFTVGDNIDAEQIEATISDGVLRLTLPKMTPSPAKKIPVKAE